jgi:hypothetical protein
MFLGFTWLMLLTFMQSGPTKAVLALPFPGLLAIASLARLSNKLFVIQAVLPAIFVTRLVPVMGWKVAGIHEHSKLVPTGSCGFRL